MHQVLLATGQRQKSLAVALALDEFLENRRRRAFVDRVVEGKTDYQASNDQLENLSNLE